MRLDKMINILYGNLLNTPYISSFDSVTCDINRIRRGALFFMQNINDFNLAIKKGAYGIVFQGSLDTKESEIALINVDNLQQSIFRLARYLILEQNYTFLMMNTLELDFIHKVKIMQNGDNFEDVAILRGKDLNESLSYFFENYKELSLESNKDSKAPKVILSNIIELEKIEVLKLCSLFYTRDMQARSYDFSNNKFIKVINTALKIDVLSCNIFDTKIIENKILTLNYPCIFLPFLQSAISLLAFFNKDSKRKIKCVVRENINFFEYFFIDSKITANRSRAMIFLPNTKIFSFIYMIQSDFFYTNNMKKMAKKLIKNDDSAVFLDILMKYFRIYASHLNTLFCYKQGSSLKKPFSKCMSLSYPNISHLKQILLKTQYDLAIVCGVNKASVGILQQDFTKPSNKLF